LGHHNVQQRVSDLDLVAMLQLDFGVGSLGSLLRGFSLLSAADLTSIHVGAVQAAEIAEADLWRQGFEEEVMPGDGGVVGQMNMAVGVATEKEGVVGGEGEDFAFGGTVGDSELNGGSHKTL
jgi:hypothetical protein